jgi:hypothetical protein
VRFRQSINHVGSVKTSNPERSVLVAGMLMLLAFCLWSLSLLAAPFGDLPSHLVRSDIVWKAFANLPSDPESPFLVDFPLRSYLLGDLMLGGLVQLFGWGAGGAVWSTGAFILVPLSVFAIASKLGLARRGSIIAALFSTYPATSQFFVLGFHHFQIAAALLILGFAVVGDALSGRKTSLAWIGYWVLIVVSYFIHPAPFIFGGVVALLLGCYGLWKCRKEFLPRLATLWLPFAALSTLHFVVIGSNESLVSWGSVGDKLLRLGSLSVRYELSVEIALLACLVAIGLWSLLKRPSSPAVHESNLWKLLLTLLIIYFALPRETTTGFEVDSRALFFVQIVMILIVAGRVDTWRTGLPLLLLVCVLAANLGLVGANLYRNNRWNLQYLELLAKLPPQSRFLPVETGPWPRPGNFMAHTPELAWFVNRSVSPYLFSRTNANPQVYFDYRDPTQAPVRTWYRREGPITWSTFPGYSHVVVTRPVDLTLMPPGHQVVWRNDFGLVLRRADF